MSTIIDIRLSAEVAGLDAILSGGLIGTRSYMLRGPADAGKTIFTFHFLQAGIDAGETVLLSI